MNDRQDLRFKILNHLDQNGRSTEEVLCNDFLSTAHHDLGTIRRTLIELIIKGYINESNVDWATEKETKSVIFNINTASSDSDAPQKNPKRLLNRQDIKEIRLYLTLEGKKFIIEWNNLKRTSWLIKYHIPMNILFLILGSGLTFLVRFTAKEKETVNRVSTSTDSLTNKHNAMVDSIDNNGMISNSKDTTRK